MALALPLICTTWCSEKPLISALRARHQIWAPADLSPNNCSPVARSMNDLRASRAPAETRVLNVTTRDRIQRIADALEMFSRAGYYPGRTSPRVGGDTNGSISHILGGPGIDRFRRYAAVD